MGTLVNNLEEYATETYSKKDIKAGLRLLSENSIKFKLKRTLNNNEIKKFKTI